jgi:hypothetical protein
MLAIIILIEIIIIVIGFSRLVNPWILPYPDENGFVNPRVLISASD